MTRKDKILRILIVVGVLYISLMAIIIVYFSMISGVFNGVIVVYNDHTNINVKAPVSSPVVKEDTPKTNTPSSSTPEATIKAKGTTTLVLKGSKFIGGEDQSFSVVFAKTTTVKDDSNLKGGGGYVGLNATAQDLDINFGLPYEASSRTYVEKVKIETDSVLGDVYRIKSVNDVGDEFIFYTNTFTPTNGYCSTDYGDSTDCADPFISSSTDKDMSSGGFAISCNLKTTANLASCDAVVKSIKFL